MKLEGKVTIRPATLLGYNVVVLQDVNNNTEIYKNARSLENISKIFHWDGNAGFEIITENLTSSDAFNLSFLEPDYTTKPSADEFEIIPCLKFFRQPEQDVYPHNGYQLHYSIY